MAYVGPVATVLGVTLMVDHSTVPEVDETVRVLEPPVHITVSVAELVFTGVVGVAFTVMLIAVRVDVPQAFQAST